MLTLDDEELTVNLFYKRSTKKDKFLGQVQIAIHALALSKEGEWYYLSDRPENERKKKVPGMLERKEKEEKEKRVKERREKKRKKEKK